MIIENIDIIEVHDWVKIKADVLWGNSNQKEAFKQFLNNKVR